MAAVLLCWVSYRFLCACKHINRLCGPIAYKEERKKISGMYEPLLVSRLFYLTKFSILELFS